MSRTYTKAVTMFAAVAVLVCLFMVGCSESPVNSVVDDGPKLLTRASRDAGAAAASPVNLYAEQVISSSEGGQLVLLDVILTVPAGAVPNDTLFSIYIPDDDVFFNEFGTDGLVFDVPVTVTMSYRGADLSGVDETTIRIGWLDESTGVWKDMIGQVDYVNKTVTATLHHFSAYGLISD
jgi:hypothetical protein